MKFCGITRVEDAEAAASLGAWAIGLNFWEGSPRRCEPAAATAISGAVRRQVEVAGVFVNASLEEIAHTAEDHSLSVVQLHGDEGPAFCSEVRRRTGCRIIKAIRVRSGADIQAAEAYRTDFHLLDAHRHGKPGGTGATFDWELLAGRHSEVPMLLAGGLSAENVAEAISIARPGGVDIASGVESEPGIKDHEAMARFAEAVRAVSEAPA